jgi:hypothetical protein
MFKKIFIVSLTIGLFLFNGCSEELSTSPELADDGISEQQVDGNLSKSGKDNPQVWFTPEITAFYTNAQSSSSPWVIATNDVPYNTYWGCIVENLNDGSEIATVTVKVNGQEIFKNDNSISTAFIYSEWYSQSIGNLNHGTYTVQIIATSWLWNISSSVSQTKTLIIEPLPAPEPPAISVKPVSGGHPKVSWSANPIADGYLLFKGVSSNKNYPTSFSQIANLSGTSYTDYSESVSGSGPNRYVWYKMKAYHEYATSGFGNSVKIICASNQVE